MAPVGSQAAQPAASSCTQSPPCATAQRTHTSLDQSWCEGHRPLLGGLTKGPHSSLPPTSLLLVLGTPPGSTHTRPVSHASLRGCPGFPAAQDTQLGGAGSPPPRLDSHRMDRPASSSPWTHLPRLDLSGSGGSASLAGALSFPASPRSPQPLPPPRLRFPLHYISLTSPGIKNNSLVSPNSPPDSLRP